MDKLDLKFLTSDKGNSQDIYYRKLKAVDGKTFKRYYSRQESFDKKYVQWGVTTPFNDDYTSGFENECPLKKDLLIKTDKGIEKTLQDGYAEKEYKFEWEEKQHG